MDLGTLVGVLIALVGILFGFLLEGGSLIEILQPTAFFIVFGGTIGATMIAFPLGVFIEACKGLGRALFEKKHDVDALITQLVGYAQKARREGIISLENESNEVKDPFLKQALQMAVDGTDPAELRQTMELELAYEEEREEQIPQVWEAAGGYAPTIGILGAVLGLIQVMKHLEDIDEVGKGIAIAFVATIYGVGSANVFFLPIAGKLKLKQRSEAVIKQMMLEGVISILEGMNPRMIETKLRAFFKEESKSQQSDKNVKSKAA
jgi:chemotaxis protein MotA